MSDLIFTIQAVAPVFLIIFLGRFLRRRHWIDDAFLKTASRLVFNVSLPALIFLQLASVDLTAVMDWAMIGYVYGGTLVSFGLAWILAVHLTTDPGDRSAFIQGSFRGNYAIIGLAMIASVYGNNQLGVASVMLAFVLPLYNFLAVIALTVPMKTGPADPIGIAKDIVGNPLILAVIAAWPVAFFQIPVPDVVARTGGYLAALTLPLALIGIGGSLANRLTGDGSRLAMWATFMKVFFMPALLTAGAVGFGYTGSSLLILFIVFGSPTAVVSFIMAESMGANSRLAGHIIALSTVASSITLAAGIYVFKFLKWL